MQAFIARDGVPRVQDDYNRQSLLTVACETGHVEVVRFLLENGGRTNHISDRVPEAFAAARSAGLDVLEVLDEYGLADPLATEHSKHGPMLFDEMFQERNAPVVRWFVERDPILLDWFICDDERLREHLTGEEQDLEPGEMPGALGLAARAGDEQLARFLIEVGARVPGESTEETLERVARNARSRSVTSLEPRPKLAAGVGKRGPSSEPGTGNELDEPLTGGDNLWCCASLTVSGLLIAAVLRLVWVFVHAASWPEIALWCGGAVLVAWFFAKLPGGND